MEAALLAAPADSLRRTRTFCAIDASPCVGRAGIERHDPARGRWYGRAAWPRARKASARAKEGEARGPGAPRRTKRLVSAWFVSRTRHAAQELAMRDLGCCN